MPRYNDISELPVDLDGTGLSIGIVMARFNIDVGEGLLAACTGELRKLGVSTGDILIATVPGALEIPGAIAMAAESGRYDGFVAIGVIIRGETYHFEVVSNESARGLLALTMDGIAIGNGIITVENEAQALARASKHDKNKGGEAAVAAMRMLAIAGQFGV